MGKIYVVGIGPGDHEMMTLKADKALKDSDVIVGYKAYIELVRDHYPDKEFIESNMKQETKRCQMCLSLAKEGKNVSLVCSGDAGVYGMASPMLEIALKDGFDDIEIISGVTAALSGAAYLGAPVAHDFCVISLSDLLTDKELIKERLLSAAKADFCVVLYNPSSHKRKDYLKWACELMLNYASPDTCCGYVMNIAREGTVKKLCTLSQLKDEQVDMFTTVFIGNSKTRFEGDWMITPRGYEH